jgi:hypothetical protein
MSTRADQQIKTRKGSGSVEIEAGRRSALEQPAGWGTARREIRYVMKLSEKCEA